MKTDEQLYFALGLAQKAGKTASGDMAVSEALKREWVAMLSLPRTQHPGRSKSGGSLQRDPCSFYQTSYSRKAWPSPWEGPSRCCRVIR